MPSLSPSPSSSRPLLSRLLHPRPRPRPRRSYTSPPPPPPPRPSQPHSRIARLLARLPRPVRTYTAPLLHAPVSHLTAFLILHELTAVVPLVGLALAFHYTDTLPRAGGLFGDGDGEGAGAAGVLQQGVERFGAYFGRKGWFGFRAVAASAEGVGEGELASGQAKGSAVGDTMAAAAAEGKGAVLVERRAGERQWQASEEGTKILIEVATAYAITKVLLPLRVLGSVWATPWFARVVVRPFGRLFKTSGARSGRGGGGGGGGGRTAAGTGATGGGVAPGRRAG